MCELAQGIKSMTMSRLVELTTNIKFGRTNLNAYFVRKYSSSRVDFRNRPSHQKRAAMTRNKHEE